jgi:hypothetical protein
VSRRSRGAEPSRSLPERARGDVTTPSEATRCCYAPHRGRRWSAFRAWALAAPGTSLHRDQRPYLLQALPADPLDPLQLLDRPIGLPSMTRGATTGPIPGRASSSAAVAVLTLIHPAGFGMVSRRALAGAFSAGGPRAAISWPTSHHLRPSLTIVTVPSRSVRRRGIPRRSRRAMVWGLGWPNTFDRPTLATASSGRTRSSQRASVPLRLP